MKLNVDFIYHLLSGTLFLKDLLIKFITGFIIIVWLQQKINQQLF